MNISQNGVNLIKGFEGLSLKAYKPVATEKYWTIGFGHSGADVKQGQVITEAQAEQLLRKDLASFVAGVNSYVKVTINQNQFDALVSLAYNIGVPALSKSTLLQKVNVKDFNGAAKEFGSWVHSGKTVLQGLVTRRAKEAALFVKPVPVPTLGTVSVITSALNVRQSADFKSKVVKVAKKGDKFTVYATKNGLYNVGKDQWISADKTYVLFKKN